MSIKPVPVHNVEVAAETRARALKHLLKANHANHSIIYHHLEFHNHAPHILGSAYILGANSEHLSKIYEAESKSLEPWHDAPGEISKDDWRDYLGKRNYQRAFIDFFEDQLVAFGYDWKRLLEYYLYEGDRPLINSIISGLGHPLIHLGYAYELNFQAIAIESLGLTTCFYSSLHKYLDDPSYTRPSSYTSASILDILERVAKDKRFDGLFDHLGSDNIEMLLQDHEDAVVDHWNAWQISSDLESQFEHSQKAAVALVVATRSQNRPKYDFFLLHLLTSSHAVRILLPIVPAKFRVSLVRQWWFFTLTAYIAQSRPLVSLEVIENFALQGRDWKYVKDMALTSQYAYDAHYVKGLRAMKNAADTWCDSSEFFLKAAVKFASEFDNWGGFGPLTKGYRPRTLTTSSLF